MASKSNIEWCDSSWNPWQGCHKVSPGCAHCYMFRDKEKFGQNPNIVVRSKDATFYAPLKWKEPLLIFTCSWSDFFIEEADFFWRPEAWEVIRKTPHHTYQILTKRPERIMQGADKAELPWGSWEEPWPNVWIGVSVENQRMADLRVSLLLQVPAAVRFLSIEPLLGPVDLSNWLPIYPLSMPKENMPPHVSWVIVGGESGDKKAGVKARPLNLDYVRSIRDQCVAADVPFFFKQYSGDSLAEVKAKGRLLDDREWNQMPERRIVSQFAKEERLGR